MSTLESEIKFIESCWQLLKTRHDESLNFTVSVDRKYHNYLLPSLSLQLLVENVVKHNSFTRQQPITISIRSTDK